MGVYITDALATPMKRVPFNTTIDEDLLREIQTLAETEGRSINWYIEHLFKDYLSTVKKRKTGGGDTGLGFTASLSSSN